MSSEVGFWIAAFVVSVAINAVLFLWTALRESLLAKLGRALEHSAATMVEVKSLLGALCAAVDRSENLDANDRRDMKELVLDVEKRISEQVRNNREWMQVLTQKLGSININGNVGQAAGRMDNQ